MIKYFCDTCGIETEKSECPNCKKRTRIISKLFWCTDCNIPVYYETCPICGKKADYFATDVRPVFPEERLLIEIILGTPMKYVQSSVWCSSAGKYYIDGESITIPLKKRWEKAPDMIRQELARFKEQNTYAFFNRYIERFIKANQTRCDYITDEAFQYIQDISRGWDNGEMFVSFSGGKDSTVVSSLVLRALGQQKIIHIYGNTTLEFPYTEKYLERFRKDNRMATVREAKNTQQDFFELCQTFGPPSRMLRWCCTIFKTGFIGQKVQRIFKGKDTVLTFYGIRRNESASRNKYERDSRGKKIIKQKVCSPIIDWFDFDIWLYILTNHLDFNEAYRLGYSRVGCWCCPNNSRWSQVLSEIYMPEESKKFNQILYDFAVKMGKSEPESYVREGSWKARSGGEGIELSRNAMVAFKPCVTDLHSFQYELKRPISPELYELFKPFGILNFEMGNKRLGEVYILDARKQIPIIKLQGRIGSEHLKITVLGTPIAARTKLVEIEMKFKCQLTKYQLCVGCHACETACRFNAITLKKGSSSSDYEYSIDEKKCVHCFECINHYQGGCYMRKVLLPRGENYVRDNKD